jgi:hypothetical protein
LATLFVVLFLIFDGHSHHSFGGNAFLTLKLGRSILFAIVVPTTLLCTLRYLNHPNWQRWAIVAMCGVAGVGTSGTGIFLVPALILVASATYVLSYGLRRSRIARACLINFASVYCVFIAGLIMSGILPAPQDTYYWDNFYFSEWHQNLFIAIGDRYLLVRDLIALMLLPLAALRAPWRRYLVVYPLVFAAMFANPVTGPLVIQLVKAGAYYRFFYLLPVPLCFGLLPACLTRADWRSLKVFIGGSARVALACSQAFLLWLRRLLAQLAQNASVTVLLQGFDWRWLRAESARVLSTWRSSPDWSPSLAFRFAATTLAIGAWVVAHHDDTLTYASSRLKPVFEYSLHPDRYPPCREMSQQIPQSANVLAPFYEESTLALLRPDLRFEAEHILGTIHTYRNVGRGEEGEQRMSASRFVDSFSRPWTDQAWPGAGRSVIDRRPGPRKSGFSLDVTDLQESVAFKHALLHGVNYIVAHEKRATRVERELTTNNMPYRELGRYGIYVLFELQPPGESHSAPTQNL